jgi:predicted P-loop ATPase
MPEAPHPIKQAAALIKQGFRVMPTVDKEPTVGGFGAESPTFTCGPEWFGEEGTEVAILCGACPALAPDMLLAIDVDGDPSAHPEMSSFLQSLPKTLASHDGRHLFFRVAADQVGRLGQWALFKRPGVEHDGLDLKWAGGYVRERWTWADNADRTALAAAIVALPGAALETLVARHIAEHPGGARAPVAPLEDRGEDYLRAHGFDPAVVRQDAVRWLQTEAPLSQPGKQGDALMLIAGALYVGFGLDDDATLELILDHYCPRAWPDEDPEEDKIEHKVNDIVELGSTRFTDLELAWVCRTARDGVAITTLDRDPPPALPSVVEVAAPGPGALTANQKQELLLTWNAHLQRTAKGEIKASSFNTSHTLRMHPTWSELFGFDEFTQNVVFLRDVDTPYMRAKAGEVFNEDEHTTGMQVWFSFYSHEPTPGSLIAAVHNAAKERRFHVVRQYLNRLRGTWDGVDRNLSEYFGAEQTPYHRTVCAKWLRSAVARAIKPGEKADSMLILEGGQGWKKSTALKCLCPDVRWFYEVASRDVGSKDFMQDMLGSWLCEIPEVDQLIRSRDESELKALLSRTVDKYRASYARKSQPNPRQLVFAGTTNEEDYLRDPTGNRRYWPVMTGTIREDLICNDRDQLWAQALAEYEDGMARRAAGEDVAIWWLTLAERAGAEVEQAGRMGQDPWTSDLLEWLGTRDPAEWFTAREALAHLPGAKPAADLEQRDLTRMGKVLVGLGCTRQQRTERGHRHWFWRLPPG